jgi:hypothetical protein
MVPTLVFPPALPATDQVTAVLVKPVTVAVNCCVKPTPIIADGGATVTVWACKALINNGADKRTLRARALPNMNDFSSRWNLRLQYFHWLAPLLKTMSQKGDE